MSERKFKVPNVTKREATRVVEMVMEDVHGEDDILSQELGSRNRVKSRSVDDEVSITDTEGGSEVNLLMAQDTTVSRVRSRFDRDTGIEEEDDQLDAQSNERDTGFAPPQSQGQVEAFDDGSIRFTPRFTKEEANYFGPGRGETPRLDCFDCAHYIEGGGCHIVQGHIEGEAHCEKFYADVGFFARGSTLPSVVTEVNLAMWGERAEKALEGSSAAGVIQGIKERLKDRIGEDFVQFLND